MFLECPLAFSHLFTLSALVPPKSLSARTPSSAHKLGQVKSRVFPYHLHCLLTMVTALF